LWKRNKAVMRAYGQLSAERTRSLHEQQMRCAPEI